MCVFMCLFVCMCLSLCEDMSLVFWYLQDTEEVINSPELWLEEHFVGVGK